MTEPAAPKKNGPARRVAAANIVKRRRGEDANTPRAPRDVREAKQAIRGGLVERLEQVESLTPATVPEANALASGSPVKLAPTAAMVAVLERIALGQYDGEVPARDAISAMRLICDFSVAKPTASVDVRQAIIRVVSPYDTDDDAAVELSAREPVPVMSIRDEEEDAKEHTHRE